MPEQHLDWSLTIRLFNVIFRTLVAGWCGVGSYPTAEMKSVYSAVPINWAFLLEEVYYKLDVILYLIFFIFY